MARKLAISDKVTVPVTIVTSNPQGRNDTYKFTLTCKRLDGESLRKQLQRDDVPAVAFLQDIVTGWDGQKLVLEADDTPSPFSVDALQDLLSIAGAPALCIKAYLSEVMAKEKN